MKSARILGSFLCLNLLNTSLPPAVQATEPPLSEHRVMILPFRNLTQQKDDNWLGDSFSESLLMGLGQVHSLKLVERAELAQVIKEQAFMQSLFADPDNAPRIGKLVGAEYMVTGSYQKIGTRIQVNARLILVQTGEIDSHSLTQVQGDLDHLFELQQNLADQLVNKLQVERKTGEIEQMKASIAATHSTEAQALYLKAKGADDGFLSDQSLQDSIANYQAALKADPNYALAWAGLAERLAMRVSDKLNNYPSKQADDTQTALAAAEQALKLQPELDLAYRARAKVFQALGRDQEALADARHAVELENSTQNILWFLGLKYPNSGNFQTEMFARLDSELQELGADFDDPLIQMTRASWYIQKYVNDPNTDLSPGLKLLQQAAIKRPDYPPIYLLMASLALLKQDFAQVKVYAEKVQQIDPDNPYLLFLTANSLRFADKERARDLALKALDIQPKYIPGRLLLMEMYQQQFKDFPAVEAQFALAKAADPDNPSVYYTAGVVYMREKRFQEAIGHLQHSIELARENPEHQSLVPYALNLQGNCHVALQQDAQAISTYQVLLNTDNVPMLTRATAHKSLASLYQKKGDFVVALEHFRQYMLGAPGYARDPREINRYRLLYLLVEAQNGRASAAVYNDIGQAYLMQEDYPQALSYLQKALQLDANIPEIHYNLGLVYRALKQEAQARSEFSRALQLKPDYSKAREALSGS